MGDIALSPTDEGHIKAVAEALFDHERRNGGKRFRDQHGEVQYRYIDKAAWVLSQAAQAVSPLSSETPPSQTETGSAAAGEAPGGPK